MSGSIASMAPAVLAREARIQFRSGLSALYLGLPLVWILIVRLSPVRVRTVLALIGLYADPVMMGAVFSGVLLARERDQGLFGAWAVTPMGPGAWLAGRLAVIGLQAAAGAAVLVLGAGLAFRWCILLPAVFFSAVSAALVGLLSAKPFRDILSFFIAGGMASSLVNLPIAGGYLAPSPLWLLAGPAWSGWTAAAAALGLGAGSEAAAGAPPGTALAAAAAWAGLLFFATRLVYRRGFFKRPGKRIGGMR